MSNGITWQSSSSRRLSRAGTATLAQQPDGRLAIHVEAHAGEHEGIHFIREVGG